MAPRLRGIRAVFAEGRKHYPWGVISNTSGGDWATASCKCGCARKWTFTNKEISKWYEDLKDWRNREEADKGRDGSNVA